MVIINENKIKEEILNLIRNSNIFSTTIRGVTTATNTFTATDGQTTFNLSSDGVKNIRSLKINGVLKTLYDDYDINILKKTKTESKVITLISGASVGDEVKIEYDYSASGDKIYPDFPDDSLKIKSFPRIYFDILSTKPTNRSANDTLQQNSLLFEFGVIGLNKDISDYDSELYELLFNNRKNMHLLNLLRPNSRSAKEPYKKLIGTLLYSKVMTFIAPAEFER